MLIPYFETVNLPRRRIMSCIEIIDLRFRDFSHRSVMTSRHRLASYSLQNLARQATAVRRLVFAKGFAQRKQRGIIRGGAEGSRRAKRIG